MSPVQAVLLVLGSAIAVGLVIKFVKGVIKFIVTIALVVICGVCFYKAGVNPVTKLADVSKLNPQYIMDMKAIAEKSGDTIKVNTDNGYSISVKVNDQWIDTSEIAKVKSISPAECEIEVHGQSIKVTDKSICSVLSLLQNAGKSTDSN